MAPVAVRQMYWHSMCGNTFLKFQFHGIGQRRNYLPHLVFVFEQLQKQDSKASKGHKEGAAQDGRWKGYPSDHTFTSYVESDAGPALIEGSGEVQAAWSAYYAELPQYKKDQSRNCSKGLETAFHFKVDLIRQQGHAVLYKAKKVLGNTMILYMKMADRNGTYIQDLALRENTILSSTKFTKFDQQH